MKKLLPFFSFALFITTANASHIIGAEMSYVCLGNNDYEVTLKIWRDCYNGVAPFDDPTYVTVFNSSGVALQELPAAFPGSDTLGVQTNCGAVIPYLCAEEASFVYTINLPPISGGYTLVYQRCCRSTIIENIVDPTDVGISVMTTIPDPSLATCNSSPVFINNPPFAFCVGTPINYDHSATDPDGDSLVYELCSGVAGADQVNPYPVPPLAPPYDDVPYAYPYSATYPFDTYPTLGINAQTGALSGTPTSIGLFSLAVCVKEYRNGNLLGVHRRELAQVYSVDGGANPSGINNIAVGRVNIYPDPASSFINISYGIWENATLTFTNVYGSVVKQLKVYQSIESTSVSVEDLPEGVYLAALREGDNIVSKKILIAR